MEFYRILQEIMDEKKMTIPDVARACNLSDSTIRTMIVRKAKFVTLEVAFKISAGLNVSLERLSGEKQEGPIIKDESSEIEKIINSLSPENRAKLLELARLYLADQHKNEESK